MLVFRGDASRTGISNSSIPMEMLVVSFGVVGIQIGCTNDADEITPCDFIRHLWSLLVTRLSASVLVASEIIMAST